MSALAERRRAVGKSIGSAAKASEEVRSAIKKRDEDFQRRRASLDRRRQEMAVRDQARNPGWYPIRDGPGDVWEMALWDGRAWFLTGDEVSRESVGLAQINEDFFIARVDP